MDWDGDGTVDARDEWMEVFNAGNRTADLGGQMLDDVRDGGGSDTDGTTPYVIREATLIEPEGFLVFYR